MAVSAVCSAGGVNPGVRRILFTFLTNLIITAGCKGIGIEPVEDRYVEFLQLIKKHKLEMQITTMSLHSIEFLKALAQLALDY